MMAVRWFVLMIAAVTLSFTPWLSGCGADDKPNTSEFHETSENNVIFRGSSLVVTENAPPEQVQSIGEQMCGDRGYSLAFDNNYYGRIYLSCGPIPNALPEQP